MCPIFRADEPCPNRSRFFPRACLPQPLPIFPACRPLASRRHRNRHKSAAADHRRPWTTSHLPPLPIPPWSLHLPATPTPARRRRSCGKPDAATSTLGDIRGAAASRRSSRSSCSSHSHSQTSPQGQEEARCEAAGWRCGRRRKEEGGNRKAMRGRKPISSAAAGTADRPTATAGRRVIEKPAHNVFEEMSTT
jgi:hypothetical protein